MLYALEPFPTDSPALSPMAADERFGGPLRVALFTVMLATAMVVVLPRLKPARSPNRRIHTLLSFRSRKLRVSTIQRYVMAERTRLAREEAAAVAEKVRLSHEEAVVDAQRARADSGADAAGPSRLIGEQRECADCQGLLDPPFELACGHGLCRTCLRGALEAVQPGSETGLSRGDSNPATFSCPMCGEEDNTAIAPGVTMSYALGVETALRAVRLDDLGPQHQDQAARLRVEAADLLKSSIVERPWIPHARTALGAVMVQHGEFEDAAVVLKAAIAQDSNDPMAHYFLGLSRLGAENPSMAIEPLERAVELVEGAVGPADEPPILEGYRTALADARRGDLPELRFAVGDRVECRIAEGRVFRPGVVEVLRYRGSETEGWPHERPPLPFLVALDDSEGLAPVLMDHPSYIRAASKQD